ncbi:MAG: alanine--glyoxylate aminotransferase family protein [Gemmatimonadetes bacterium]|nr:alanine--glyoxylate aminotransferase family protein [Gemmatimonadota bacterium]
MTPGPTRVPEQVLRAGARPMLHHRSPEFSQVLAAVMERLRPVMGTREPVLPVHTTGRGAMEAAICNLFSPRDEVAVCCNGKFGEMWADLAQLYGLVVHRIAADWNRSVDPLLVEAALVENRRIRGVLFAYCDTANGVRNDVAGIARVARARGALVLVDGVSAIGGMPFEFDDWDVDFAVTASQKCLMSGPGLAFVAVSERAWSAAASGRLPRSYWDFAEIRQHVTRPKPETPGTPPVHVICQVAEALAMIHDEGLERGFRRHEDMAALTRKRAGELGLQLQCPRLEQFSPTVTAIAVPPGVQPSTLRERLKRRGILTAAGLGIFAASGFRIGHMGNIQVADVERTMAALEAVLASPLSPLPSLRSGQAPPGEGHGKV